MNHKIISKITSSALLFTIVTYLTTPVFAFTKEETVYSKLNSEGNNYNTIVNSHIENKNQEQTINDISDLLNIKNIDGDQEFKQDGNSLVWNAEGSDIYYQGESQKELPIECKVKYELDGKEIQANELAGKSGKIKITIEYINKDAHDVNINGKNETMYTPFVVVCGTIINNDNNKNIEITNGKAIEDGTKTTLIGMSIPGMQESLNISKDKLEIPNKIEITMESTDFELNNIVTYVTPKLIEDDDIELFDDIDKIYSKVDTLQSSANQIQEGANTLAQGTDKLSSSVGELKTGSNAAYTGANKIKKEVEKSTKALVSDKSEALDSKTISEIGNKASEEASKQIESTAKAIGNSAASQVANIKLTNEQKAKIKEGVEKGLKNNENYNLLPDQQKVIVLQFAQESAINSAESVAQDTAKEVASQTAKQVAKSTAKQVAKSTAETTSREVANQVKQEALSQVSKQMETLGTGLNELTNGLYKIDNGTSKLQNGANELNTGANTLAEGVTKFNNEGIKQICNYINGDAKDITTRVEKLKELSKQYNNFTMLNDGEEGNVKFIMIMDGIKKEESNKQEAIIDNQNNSNNKKTEE